MHLPVFAEAIGLAHLRLLRWRSLPLLRSTNTLFTSLLTSDNANAANTAATLP
jgi:hypothetical protein